MAAMAAAAARPSPKAGPSEPMAMVKPAVKMEMAEIMARSVMVCPLWMMLVVESKILFLVLKVFSLMQMRLLLSLLKKYKRSPVWRRCKPELGRLIGPACPSVREKRTAQYLARLLQ